MVDKMSPLILGVLKTIKNIYNPRALVLTYPWAVLIQNLYV